MDILDAKIQELLSDAKGLLRHKQYLETIEKLKQVLQLDSENEEAIYVLDRINKVTGILTVPQKKMVIIADEPQLNSELHVFFNGIDISTLKDGFFEFVVKNDGKLQFEYKHMHVYVPVKKNMSSIIHLVLDNYKNQLFYNQVEFDNLESILELSMHYVETDKHNTAKSIINQALAHHPTSSLCYFQLLLIDLNYCNVDQLNDSMNLLNDNYNYKKAINYAEGEFRTKLISYANTITENIYKSAIIDAENGLYKNALMKFNTIKNYRDSEDKIIIINDKLNEIAFESEYKKGMELFNQEKLYEALSIFLSMRDYKDSSSFLDKINKQIEDDKIYQSCKIYEPSPKIETIKLSISRLKSLGNYKNAHSLVALYETLLSDAIEQKKRADKQLENTKKQIKRLSLIASFIIVITTVLLIINTTVLVPTNKYNNALSLIDTGNYNEAKTILSEINGFSDSENQITIIDAYIAFDNQNYEEGIALLEGIGFPVVISYDLDGGYSSTLNRPLNIPLSLSDDTPNKDGYIFNGWELIDYFINNEKNHYSAEVDLKATYLLSQYTIIFEMNGGEGVSNLTYSMNSDTILLSNPTRIGYTFNGWYDNPNFNGESIDKIISGSTGDIILYAAWTINEYTLSFNSNGGTLVNSITQDFNTTVYEPIEPTMENYVFDGWYKNSALTELYTFNTMPADDITLYAKWIYKYYTINYDSNGGNLLSPQQVEYEKTYNLALPTRANYSFLGWYLNNVLFEGGVWTKTTDITLVARWDSIYEYTVNGSNVIITGFKYAIQSTTIVFPQEIFGLPVVQIGEATSKYSTDKPIGIPSNVTSITVPNTVQRIGLGAFNGASSLISLTIPFVGESRLGENEYHNLGYIFGREAFNNSYLVQSWDGTYYQAGYYYLPNSLTNITITDTTILGDHAFHYIKNITRLILPNNLISIGYMAFDSTGITGSIIIPWSVTTISRNAFQYNGPISTFTIYVRANSRPSGWSEDWIGVIERVVWGYTGS